MGRAGRIASLATALLLGAAGGGGAQVGWETFGEADLGWRIEPLGGAAVELERFRGEVLFVNVWASWCTPCVRELGSIERLRVRLADTDVRFLIVAAEAERSVRRFLRRYPYDLPIYLERTAMPPSFGLRGLPTTWVVDRDGRIALLRHGEAVWDTDEVERFLRVVAGTLSAVDTLAVGVGVPP